MRQPLEFTLRAVAAFRWVASPERPEPTRRSWLARVFEVPEGEPTDTQLAHIASLSPGERLWFERGVVAGGTVVVPHEALSDTPAFLAVPRLRRRFGCTAREAAGLAELFLALEASPAVVAHYESEAHRVGIAAVVEELVHLVAGVALAEPVPDSDALDAAQSLGEDVEQVDQTGCVARWAVHSERAGALPAVEWHALGTVHLESAASERTGATESAETAVLLARIGSITLPGQIGSIRLPLRQSYPSSHTNRKANPA